ncbi:DNA invertase Pin-like site-specific DNA recombinase [Paraburkholderia sp. Clong3]|uniref:recombinase family protein n=1 Tax=Paraburkholderia sp. Clong3 TaxID=2991061 RepID=UPI003D1C02E4
MSDKIRAQHLARKAMLYVRQSSAYQVSHNLESQKLQYAMQDRLHQLGWNEIEVIDEDLGRSAAGTQTRTGFERMVAEVCLGHVGAVAAREVSRFARNSREWQQLVEVCRVVDTVLVDQETVYSPRQSNDRLLLGLKGSLNEYELDLLRQRSLEARREKAKRGSDSAAFAPSSLASNLLNLTTTTRVVVPINFWREECKMARRPVPIAGPMGAGWCRGS